MNSLTYALCNKPVIGTVMWLSSLCSFPPLFKNVPINLNNQNATVTTTFEAPIQYIYKFDIDFNFTSTEARLNDEIVGDRHSKDCDSSVKYDDIPESKRDGLGHPIPFRVIILKAEDNSIVLDKIFESKCLVSYMKNRKTRRFGKIPLEAGKYKAHIINLEKQTGLEKIQSTTLSLTPGRVWK